MNISQLIDLLEKKAPLESDEKIAEFEAQIGARLPDKYRAFLQECNGGQVGTGLLDSLSLDGNVGIRWFGGFRSVSALSLEHHRIQYQNSTPIRIPLELIWIGGDVFGNSICLGIHGSHRGKIFFWDHEYQPDPDDWDGSVETSGNIWEVAESFQEFIEELKTDAEMERRGPFDNLEWKGTATLKDGRKFIAGASFLIELSYIEILRKPKKIIPSQQVERLLAMDTTACFQLDELHQRPPRGNYQTPNNILLNKKYIQLLQQITTQDGLYLRTSTPHAAVIFCDGKKIIGALMPIKVGPADLSDGGK